LAYCHSDDILKSFSLPASKHREPTEMRQHQQGLPAAIIAPSLNLAPPRRNFANRFVSKLSNKAYFDCRQAESDNQLQAW